MLQKSNRSTQIFCSLFIIIGLIAAGIGIWLLTKGIHSEHWPVTEGVVQSAKMNSDRGSKGRMTYLAQVTYSYQVAGKSYTGDKVSIGQMSSSSPSYAQGILNRYPVGKKVSVHYLPDNPSEAVLETGIHGGTWICLSLGAVFTLFGILFLQINRAAARAQLPGAPPSSSVTVQPDGSFTLAKPPVLMGVIFLLVGIGLCFVKPDGNNPGWLMYVVGGVFGFGGLLLLLARLENKLYSKIATLMVLALFLVILHWIAFGASERNSTASGLFFFSHPVNVRTPFAIVTIALDVILVAGLIYGLIFRQSIAQNKSKWRAMAGLVLLLALGAVFFVSHKTAPAKKLSMGTPFVSTPINDAFWLKLNRRRSDKYRKQLNAAPPVLVVRETHYAFNPTNGIGNHYGWLDGRLANLHISFSELVADAYGMDYTHTEFPKKWTQGHWTNCYDVIATITNQPKAALQAAAKQFLRQQYGLSWHLENRNTDVLVLRVKDPQLLQSKATQNFARSKSIPEFCSELEHYFNEPVIDETGATNRYDKTIGNVPSRWINGRSTDLEFNNQFLATVGLELIATNRPQKWLRLDR